MSEAETNADAARDCLRRQGFDCPDEPTVIDGELTQLWLRLLREETAELSTAFESDDLVGIADALADILCVTYQAAANCGLPIDKVFAEVHRSNLTKIPSKGSVLYREDGKVMKPTTSSPPDIGSILAPRDDA